MKISNIIRDMIGQNRLTEKQVDRVKHLDIRFSTTTKDYLNSPAKQFNEKRFTPITRKPKNLIDKDNREIFYNIIDHYPNSIGVIERVNNKKPIEIYITGKGVPRHKGYYTDGLYAWDKKGTLAMLNVMNRPQIAGHTLFHEMRHAQQNRGMAPVHIHSTHGKFDVIRSKVSDKEYDTWKNKPEEKDAEQYAHKQLKIGERQAKPPHKDEIIHEKHQTRYVINMSDGRQLDLRRPIPHRDHISKNDNQLYMDPNKAPKRAGLRIAPKDRMPLQYAINVNKAEHGMWMMPTIFPKATFIGRIAIDEDNPAHIKYLANTIGHEEIHTALQDINPPTDKRHLSEATKKFDNIVVPTVPSTDFTQRTALLDSTKILRNRQPLNPYSAQNINPTFRKKITRERWEDDKDMVTQEEQEAYRDETSENMAVITGADLPEQEHLGASKLTPYFRYVGHSVLEVGKPRGGFWTSSVSPTGRTDWKRFAKHNIPAKIDTTESIRLQPHPHAKIFQIANKKDYRELLRTYPIDRFAEVTGEYKKKGETLMDINWPEVAQDYDAVNITQEAAERLKFGTPGLARQNPWESESTVWFNPAFNIISDNTSKNDNQLYLYPRDAPMVGSNILKKDMPYMQAYAQRKEIPIKTAIKQIVQGHLLNSIAFTAPRVFPNATFIGHEMKNINFDNPKNINALGNILTHEEMHQVLQDTQGREASTNFDNITHQAHIEDRDLEDDENIGKIR